MRITVKLFAHHRVGRFKEEEREYPENASVGQIFEELRIVKEKRGIILINGHQSTPEHRLEDGDTLALFPLVAGG